MRGSRDMHGKTYLLDDIRDVNMRKCKILKSTCKAIIYIVGLYYGGPPVELTLPLLPIGLLIGL